MPNDLSNEFHADIKAAVAFAERLLAEFEAGAGTLIRDIKVVFAETVDDAGPILAAAAAAGVNAALGAATGGLSAIATAAEGAALAVLETKGVVLAEEGFTQLKTLILGNVLKSSADVGATGQAPAVASIGDTVVG